MQDNPIVLGFTAGELSPWLESRFDLQAYQRGAAVLKNFLVQPYGGIRRRYGTKWIGPAYDQESGAVRLVPFRFSESDVLMLEFFPGGMRVYRDAALVTGDDGEPYVLDVPWDSADVIAAMEPVQVNDVIYVTHPHFPPYALSRYADNQWTCTELSLQPYPRESYQLQDGLLVVSMHQGGETATLETESPTLRFTSDMAGREYVLADAPISPQTYFLNRSYPLTTVELPDLETSSVFPGSVYHTYDEAEGMYHFYYCRSPYSKSMFTGSKSPLDYRLCFIPGAFVLDENRMPFEVCGDWELETYGEWNGMWELWRSYDSSLTLNDYTQWQWTCLHSFHQDGSQERKNWAFSGSEDRPCRMVLICKAQSTKPLPAMLCFRLLGGQREYKLRIVSVESETKATAEVLTPYLDEPKVFSTRSWSFGAFGSRNGYPSFCNLHQGRLWFGGTAGQPTTLFGSSVDDYGNFLVGSNDDDALHVTMATSDQSRICWICPARSLLVGTTSSEWTLSTASGSAITATTALFSRQSSVGSDRLGANGVENTVFYVQRGGKRLREISYKLEADGFTSTDTSLLAEHLFEAGVREWTVQKGSNTQLWVLMRDGLLAVLTMNAEQQVTAWQRVEFPGREVLHLSALTSSDSNEDELWLVLRNRASGCVSLERMVEGASFVDGAVSCATDGGAALSVSLPHLAGLEVCARAYLPEKADDTAAGETASADASAATEAVAANSSADVSGAEALPSLRLSVSSDGALDLPATASGAVWEIGSVFTSELQTMPQEREVNFNTVRQVGRVKLRVRESDPSFEYRVAHVARWEQYEPRRDGLTGPYTGAIRLTNLPQPGVAQGFCLRYDGAGDFRLLSLVMEVDTHGR